MTITYLLRSLQTLGTRAFDELERDIKDTRVLAFDGSSTRLLHLMSLFAAIPGVA